MFSLAVLSVRLFCWAHFPRHPYSCYPPMNIHLTTYLWAFVMFAIVLIEPGQALAFEASLAISPSINYGALLQNNLQNQTATINSAIAAPTTETVIQIVAAPTPALLATTKAPEKDRILVLEGVASYYSRQGCLGCNALRIMANGQPLNDKALTMAIGADKRHLVGASAKVTNLATGRSAVVKITDTGGFYAEKYGRRVADLSVATKEAIGMRGGLGKVRVEVF